MIAAAREHKHNEHRSFFLPFLLILLVAMSAAPTFAAMHRADYRLELVLETDELTDAFVHVSPLERSDFYAFDLIRRDRLQEELDMAIRALAERLGYDPAVYGEDFYKLVRVTRWRYRLVDDDTDRVLDEGSGLS